MSTNIIALATDVVMTLFKPLGTTTLNVSDIDSYTLYASAFNTIAIVGTYDDSLAPSAYLQVFVGRVDITATDSHDLTVIKSWEVTGVTDKTLSPQISIKRYALLVTIHDGLNVYIFSSDIDASSGFKYGKFQLPNSLLGSHFSVMSYCISIPRRETPKYCNAGLIVKKNDYFYMAALELNMSELLYEHVKIGNKGWCLSCSIGSGSSVYNVVIVGGYDIDREYPAIWIFKKDRTKANTRLTL